MSEFEEFTTTLESLGEAAEIGDDNYDDLVAAAVADLAFPERPRSDV